MKSQDLKKLNIPDKPGVYFFKRENNILYIGKATSLRSRVRSYFGKDLIATRGPVILDMTVQANTLKWEVTDSVLEALILEAELIKQHQPKYNTKEKDNKSFNYVCITKEKLPKVLVIRGRKLKKSDYKKVFGPFPNGLQLREAMRIIRKIFPYFDNHSDKKQNYQFYKQLSLIPEGDYKNNIRNLILFFQGKKKKIIISLKKDMMEFAKKREFEKAGEVKKKIFALEHINDVALIKEDKSASDLPERSYRIEAYDIAHMSGKNMVGVMTVVEAGLPAQAGEVAKQEYKKFIIKSQTGSPARAGGNDTGALEEVLSRRFRHTEWGLPNLVVVDGSTAQLNVAKRVLNRYQFDIPIVAVVKDDKHKARALIGDEALIKIHKKSILLSNSEAHRFGITFHKQKRNKNFLK
jgi:excinuclease ABC subunit C